MAKVQLSAVGEIVRRHDPDRFFTALFAPARHRETLLTLYAFNHELARAREAVREPHMALIRLQWWREVIEGARRRHEVARPLGDALDSGALAADDLMTMIDAREAETEAMPDVEAFLAYVRGTAGGLMVAAGRALGMRDAEDLRERGAAYGIVGVLRHAEALARAGRNLLPPEPGSRDTLEGAAEKWLTVRRTFRRDQIAAVLPAVIARSRLHGGSSLLRERWSVLVANLTRRA